MASDIKGDIFNQVCSVSLFVHVIRECFTHFSTPEWKPFSPTYLSHMSFINSDRFSNCLLQKIPLCTKCKREDGKLCIMKPGILCIKTLLIVTIILYLYGIVESLCFVLKYDNINSKWFVILNLFRYCIFWWKSSCQLLSSFRGWLRKGKFDLSSSWLVLLIVHPSVCIYSLIHSFIQ